MEDGASVDWFIVGDDENDPLEIEVISRKVVHYGLNLHSESI